MKGLKLLIILLSTSLLSFSQGLKPTVLKSGRDTLLCFTIPQSKMLAKQIIGRAYADSICAHREGENTYLYQALEQKDSVLHLIQVKADLIDSVNNAQHKTLLLQQTVIETQNKTIRKTRRQRTLLGIGLTIVTVLALL